MAEAAVAQTPAVLVEPLAELVLVSTQHSIHAHFLLVREFKSKCCQIVKVKGKGFPYSIPSAGPRADPSVQAVSLQVTVSHPPIGRLPLLSTRPAVTSPAAEHRRVFADCRAVKLVH